jgi:hypothetical protein
MSYPKNKYFEVGNAALLVNSKNEKAQLKKLSKKNFFVYRLRG